MNYILFDENRDKLLPLTYTRSVSEIRVGILTIIQKWQYHLDDNIEVKTVDYLQSKYDFCEEPDSIYINAGLCPNSEIIELIKNLDNLDALYSNENVLLAYRNEPKNKIVFNSSFIHIEELWHIFQYNAECIISDFKLLTKNKVSKKISDTNKIIGTNEVFLEDGVKIEHAFLNTSSGPIYIGENSEVMEGSMIRGPFAMCENSVVKMGSKIYEGTTFGPYCKVGGEVNNSVLLGYTNKSHDGFLGNSVLGEWCNIGADTNSSNLKNNYADVRIWSESDECFKKTGLQFFGLIMGDHSKCSINTMFNTGTIIGVSANIFGTGFPRNFIPSFSWGGSSGYTTYKLDKVFDVVSKVMLRRNKKITNLDKDILTKIFDLTSSQRKF